MLKTIFFNIALYLWFVLWAPALLVGLASARLSRWLIIQDAWGVLWLAHAIAGIRYEVIGHQTKGAIIAAKHMSVLEVAILMTHCRNAFFIIKRELLMIPIYGWSFWRMGFIGVNRKKGATNMKTLAAEAAGEIKAGKTLIIFPEGSRALPGKGVQLKRGLLFIAETAGIPIQPVGADTGLFWPKKGAMRAGVAHIWMEPPLPFDATLEEVADSIARHSA